MAKAELRIGCGSWNSNFKSHLTITGTLVENTFAIISTFTCLLSCTQNFLTPKVEILTSISLFSHCKYRYVHKRKNTIEPQKRNDLQHKGQGKVHIFWEGHKILRNLHLTFVLCKGQLISECLFDFFKFSKKPTKQIDESWP